MYGRWHALVHHSQRDFLQGIYTHGRAMDSWLLLQPGQAVSFLLQPVSLCPFCTTKVVSIAPIRFHSKRRNVWAVTCSGSSPSKKFFARCLYARKGNGFLPSVAARPSWFLSFTASLLVPFLYDESCVHSSLLVFLCQCHIQGRDGFRWNENWAVGE